MAVKTLVTLFVLVLTIVVVNGTLEMMFDLPTLLSGIIGLISLVDKQDPNVIIPILSKTKTMPPENEDGSIYATTISLINAEGYDVETHYVTTPDQYIKKVYRIPNAKGEQYNSSQIPIVLQHGILMESDMWVSYGEQNSLGFQLANMGYDVWLGNFRGNEYSRNGTSKNSPNSYKFWCFSWQQNAASDIPALLDYIEKETGHRQVIWIGYSMGTTSIMALLASQPQYNDRILGFIGLAPATRLRYGVPSIYQSIKNYNLVTGLFNTLGETGICSEFFHTNDNIKTLWQLLCPEENPFVCILLLDILFGIENESMLNTTYLPHLLAQFPAGGSLGQFLHYIQTGFSAKFQKYDYFKLINEVKYGQLTPPQYNLANIVAPTYFIYGENDCLTNPLDQAWQMPQIPGLRQWTHVDWLTYTHADFLLSQRNYELLFPLVFNYLDDIMLNSQSKAA